MNKKNKLTGGILVFALIIFILFVYSSWNGRLIRGEVGSDDIVTVDGVGAVDKTTTLEDMEEKAIDWVKTNASTYRERSKRGEVEVVESREPREGLYEIVLEFEAEYDGYGLVEDERKALEEPETRRTVISSYYDGIEVVLTDGVYEEVSQRKVEDEEQVYENLYESIYEHRGEMTYLREEELPEDWQEKAELFEIEERENITIEVYQWKSEDDWVIYRHQKEITEE